jgi:hypothetical protein
MADRKEIVDDLIVKETTTVKVILGDRIIKFTSDTAPPEPPADNSVPWMSFF